MSEDFSNWIGKSESVTDRLEPARSNALSATCGTPADLKDGDVMPLLHHWLYFWNVQPPEGLGTDGHPAKGGFLPPIPLPRRMWAGGRLRFEKPLRFGDEVTKTSTILKVQEKSGKSGVLVFVTVEHKLSVGGETAIVEEQDLVYREAAAAGSITGPQGEGPEPTCTWHTTLFPDEVMLFRYSALTMNGHRIHYDLPYARDEEAYPALVVQGPFQATCLIDMAARELGKPLSTFSFRGMSPAFGGTTLHVCGERTDEGVSVWTEQAGAKCMTASAS